MKQKHLMLKGILGLVLVFVVLTGCPTDSDSGSNNGGGGGGAPGGVTVAPDNQKLIVSWNAVSGATGYRVVWGMNITEPPATLTNQNSGDINGTTTTYTITGLTNGNSYSVWVAAKKADNTTYSGYSGMKTATPNQSTAAPGKPVVTVTPTDDGQLRIDWGAVQYASSYTVHVGATNDIASATSVAQNLTALTYTASRPQGVTSLTFYVWVSAINTTQGANNATTHSEPEAGTILDAPIDSTAVIGTWRSSGGATYTFSGTNNVVFKEDGSTTKGEGTFGYNKPSLTLNITASGGYQAPNAWNNGQVTVNGKTFTISNITYTKQ